ncbi:hypothetical protein OQA88_7415 [Cercophora sp. LCS_1]
MSSYPTDQNRSAFPSNPLSPPYAPYNVASPMPLLHSNGVEHKDDVALTEHAHQASEYNPGGYEHTSARSRMAPELPSQGRWRGLLASMKHHLPALMASFFLLAVNVTEWVWPPPGPSKEVLSALQFAAKLHESLMMFSLAHILLHRVRYLLKSNKGVPLTLLTAPFQLNSPHYIVSKDFWRVAFGGVGVATVSLLSVCLFFAIALGPFSAIIIIPRNQQWSVPSAFPNAADFFVAKTTRQKEQDFGGVTFRGGRPYQHTSTPSEMYPVSVGPELGIIWQCPEVFAAFPGSFGCSTHFSDKWPVSIINSRLVALDALANNIKSGAYKEFISPDKPCHASNETGSQLWLCARNERSAVAMSSGPSNLQLTSLMREGDLLFRHINQTDWHKDAVTKLAYTDALGKSIPMKQPFVATHCLAFQSSRTEFVPGLRLPFPRGIYPEFNLTVDEMLHNLAFQDNIGLPLSDSLQYVNLQPYVPFPISAGAIATSAVLSRTANNTAGVDPNNRVVQVCYSVGRWVESDVWMESPFQAPSFSIVGKRPVEHIINETERLNPAEIVKFNPRFMMDLEEKPFILAGAKNLVEDPASNYEWLVGHCADSARCLATGISGMMQYTLSHAPCAFANCMEEAESSPLSVVYNYTKRRSYEEAEASGDFVFVQTDLLINAYGYGFQGDRLVPIAIVVLLLHAFIAVIHTLLVLFGGWSNEALASLGELLTLGIQSAAPKFLRTNSVGRGSHATWDLQAKMMTNMDNDRLELVIEPKGGHDPADYVEESRKGARFRGFRG